MKKKQKRANLTKHRATPVNKPMRAAESPNKIVVRHETEFRGPLPPPAVLQEYNQISPGMADRIIAMAENEAAHRHNFEHKALAADIGDQSKMFSEARIGQLCGLLIGLAAIGAGAYTATHGAQWPGGIIGGTGVIGLVSVFISGRKQKPPQPTPSQPAQQ